MTTKYCGFLRGINVGNIRINMDDLKQLLEKEGFTGVKTFLQTGNVSFKSEKTAPELKEILEKKLSTRFEYEAYIQILPFTQLNEIISSYPFIKNESEHCYIVFTQKKSTIAELLEAFQNTENPSEQVTKSIDNERIIYWQTSKGHSTNSAFAKILLQKKFKSTTTVRNINTLQKMVQY